MAAPSIPSIRGEGILRVRRAGHPAPSVPPPLEEGPGSQEQSTLQAHHLPAVILPDHAPAELFLELIDQEPLLICPAMIPASQVIGGEPFFLEAQHVLPVMEAVGPPHPVPVRRVAALAVA